MESNSESPIIIQMLKNVKSIIEVSKGRDCWTPDELKGIKNTVEFADKEDLKLRALFKLADIMDMEDKNSSKITQLTGAVFQGFTDNMIEGAERPEEITSEAT